MMRPGMTYRKGSIASAMYTAEEMADTIRISGEKDLRKMQKPSLENDR